MRALAPPLLAHTSADVLAPVLGRRLRLDRPPGAEAIERLGLDLRAPADQPSGAEAVLRLVAAFAAGFGQAGDADRVAVEAARARPGQCPGGSVSGRASRP
jgi:hypothetical protein